MAKNIKNFTHTHLTHVLRRRPDLWAGRPRTVSNMLRGTMPFVGELPPELRVRVPREKIGQTFRRFANALDEQVRENGADMIGYETYRSYDLPEIREMFNMDCVLISHNPKWLGAFGAVSHLIFEDIEQEYALKIFYNSDYERFHGPLSEIPTAFAAYRAEPQDNEKVHLARMVNIDEDGAFSWTLSNWIDVDADIPVTRTYNDNQYKIFETAPHEVRPDNFLSGRRTDFGDTWRTVYGGMSYRARKLYRCLTQLINSNDVAAFHVLANKYRSGVGRCDWESALQMYEYVWGESRSPVGRAISQALHRVR